MSQQQLSKAPHTGAVHTAHPNIKREESAQITAEIQAFEAAGGVVEILPFGASSKTNKELLSKNRQQMTRAERERASAQRLAQRRMQDMDFSSKPRFEDEVETESLETLVEDEVEANEELESEDA